MCTEVAKKAATRRMNSARRGVIILITILALVTSAFGNLRSGVYPASAISFARCDYASDPNHPSIGRVTPAIQVRQLKEREEARSSRLFFLPQGMFASVQATMVGWKPARVSKHFAGSEAQGNLLSSRGGRGKGQGCVLNFYAEDLSHPGEARVGTPGPSMNQNPAARRSPHAW